MTRSRHTATWIRILLAAAISSAAVWPAGAAEYFVARRGNDSADGRSEATAFATVAKGVAGLQPGDTLTILPGTYCESVSAKISGKPGASITIRAQRPGTALLRGDVDAPAFRPVEGMRHTYVAEFKPRVEGVAERSTLRRYEPAAVVSEVPQANASFFQDDRTGRLYVHTSDSGPPAAHALSVSVTSGFGLLLTPPRGSATVHDVIVDGLSFTGYQARDFPPTSEPGSRNRWGLAVVMAERVTVRRCVSFLNSGGIYLLAPTDSLVEDCHTFANASRFLDLGNNLLGWSPSDTTFRRNRAESFSNVGSSGGDITFYGGARADQKPGRGVMESNLVVNGGIMIKGDSSKASVQRGNSAVGTGAYFYQPAGAANLLLPDYQSDKARQTYADPLHHDYRLQSDAAGAFFVSPSGDDAEAGTSLARAWRTLAHAARSARPGHTIYVTQGEYAETLAPAQSGTAEKPIRFVRHGRDRVVLDGGKRLPVGVDLSGRSHVTVEGFLIRDFVRAGILAQRGEQARVEWNIVTGCSGDGVAVSAVSGLTFAHNLLRDCRGAGLRLARSPGAMVTGNLFESCAGARLVCDAASLDGLWSDANAFPPAAGSGGLIEAAGQRYGSLAAWQRAASLDPCSLAAAAGYRDAQAGHGEFALRPDSPLVGRGPHATAIGPFLRIAVKRPLPIENLTVHDVTDTTATVEWWTPTQAAETTLEWGGDAKCANKTGSRRRSYHTASLTGLKPGATYHFRVTSIRPDEELVFAPHAAKKTSTLATAPAKPQTLQTAATPAPPRAFHVAVTGDDRRGGASVSDAWRTLNHAADVVRAGDTVWVHGGAYEETVVIRSSGAEGAPITFRAAPGETVWMDGSGRFRTTAFRLAAKHHIHLDGFRFRHFRYAPSVGPIIEANDSSHIVIRRCFHDGRELDGYVGNFIGGTETEKLTVENCVMINGMGEGLSVSRCAGLTVRHCVFYNNFIRALTAGQFEPHRLVTLSHNLFCDTIPSKTNNAFIRLSHLDSLRSDHNVFFARKGPAERRVVETANIAGKTVGYQAPGAYHGETLLLADVRRLVAQEQHSRFGNPALSVVAELLPPGAPESAWRKIEMHREGSAFGPLDFADFIPAPANLLARAADGRPVGLDPEAFK